MSGRIRLAGLAIAAALLANGVANKANAGSGACTPVKACAPVKAAPAVPVCKPVKPLPPPEVCKPVQACAGVDAHGKYVTLRDHITRFANRFKKPNTGKEVYRDAPQPAPSETAPAPAPAPTPQPPTA
jgi:hypothetical protein